VVTSGAVAGSTNVSGTAAPNETNCIQVWTCGPDFICGNGDDQAISPLTSTNSSGVFQVGLTEVLTCRERIFAKDICFTGGTLQGPITLVDCVSPAPVLSGTALKALVAILCVVGLIGLTRLTALRANRSA